MHKGTWHEEEDERLITFVKLLGSRRWDYVARVSGLKRSGKSCRLRWSMIARRLPGRTDNEIKNYWRTHLRKKAVIQDQDYRFGRDYGKQLFLFQEDDGSSNSKTYNGESYNPCVDISDNQNSCYDGVASVSDFDLTNSPYETKISDRISEFPSDQSEIKPQLDSNTTLSCYSYPAWFSEEIDLWGCSLWNME